MPEGWVGFNPDKVQDSIMALYHEGYTLGVSVLDSAARNLFRELSKLWYSPKAKEFDNMYRVYIHDLLDRAYKLIIDLCAKAQQAYNVHSISNGLGVNTNFIGWVYGLNPEYDALQEVSPNGSTGMYIYEVKKVLDQYVLDVARGLGYIEGLPNTIDLYDPGSEQRTAFLGAVLALSEIFRAEMYNMSKLIRQYIQIEQNTVFRGAQQAIDALNG